MLQRMHASLDPVVDPQYQHQLFGHRLSKPGISSYVLVVIVCFDLKICVADQAYHIAAKVSATRTLKISRELR